MNEPMDAKMKSIIKKVELAWKKWNDGAVKEAEKQAIKATIQKTLDKYGLSLDWTTGKVIIGKAKQEEPKKEKASTKQGMSTKDLISFIYETYGDEWTGKNLRRKIRQMDRWNDGKMTHYDFTSAQVDEILIHLGYKKAS